MINNYIRAVGIMFLMTTLSTVPSQANSAANIVGLIENFLKPENSANLKLGDDITNTIIKLDKGTQLQAVQHLLKLMREDDVPYFPSIGKLYPYFFEIPNLSAHDIMYLTHFYLNNNKIKEMEGMPLRAILEKAFQNGMLPKEYVQAIYDLKDEMRRNFPDKYEQLKKNLTPGVNVSIKQLGALKNAETSMNNKKTAYNKILADANKVLSKYRIKTLLNFDDMIKQQEEDLEDDTMPEFTKDLSEDDRAIVKIAYDQAAKMVTELKDYEKAKMAIKNAAQNQNYPLPAMDLRRTFEEQLTPDKAKQFFQELGLENLSL